MLNVYDAANATLFMKQNPLLQAFLGSSVWKVFPKMPAWWPGGLVAQKAFLYSPLITASTAWTAAPAALRAAYQDSSEVTVSLASN